MLLQALVLSEGDLVGGPGARQGMLGVGMVLPCPAAPGEEGEPGAGEPSQGR